MCNPTYDSPATLVAILVAAKKAGDRELERVTRRQLEERHGIKLSFAAATERQGRTDANP